MLDYNRHPKLAELVNGAIDTALVAENAATIGNPNPIPGCWPVK